jgi:hypothetical protein
MPHLLRSDTTQGCQCRASLGAGKKPVEVIYNARTNIHIAAKPWNICPFGLTASGYLEKVITFDTRRCQLK